MDSILDPYNKKIDDHWDEITGMYVAFEKKKPIIEFEPNRTRNQAKKQYRDACATGAIMVFVRDEQKEILRSYIFPRADEE